LLSEAAALLRGEVVVAREVLVRTASGVRVRLDLVTRNLFTGSLRFIDAKFGPGARLTPNQKVGYPDLAVGGGVVEAQNAVDAGLPKGTPLGRVEVLVDWWQ
jgi:hypothetical protein